ncbi:NADH-quinone oxidoreductase subunit N [Sphaerimonospora sp. CA-214678]|uniref:NADH-quinone oxidoreductase subunit N n=1 Tax=Sphaerimonospora sp. CA-214678 TaxID=3240029 RepID=UPI003D8EF7FA
MSSVLDGGAPPVIQSIDYAAIAAPLILVIAAGLVLLLDAFLPHRPGTGRALGLVALGGVLAALAVVVVQTIARTHSPDGARRTFCVPSSLSAAGDAGSCSFAADRFALVFAGLVLAAGVVIVLLSMTELAGGRIPVGEWHLLLLAALTGAVLLPASRDLIMLVVSLELVSLPVFALIGLRRYDGRAAEAALKLFLVSVVSTAIMLFGVSLLYGMTGSVHLDRLARAYEAGPAIGAGAVAAGPESAVTAVAIVLVVAGFAFKIAAVPFHTWAGDVYQGSPVPVAALLSVVSKAAGFAGLILVLTTALPSRAGVWTPIVAVVAALTMTAGNVLAIRQRHAVRLLAWSSVAQSGYILAPLAAAASMRAGTSGAGSSGAAPPGTVPPRAALPGTVLPGTVLPGNGTSGGDVIGGAVAASIAYLVFYAAMNLTAFAIVMIVSRRRVRNEIDDYRGLVHRNPAAGLALAFSLVCLAGLPPGLAGLFAKIVVFREVVGAGLGWLALVMAVNTVIGLYYYIAWTARLFTPETMGESRTVSAVPAGAGAPAVTGAPGVPGCREPGSGVPVIPAVVAAGAAMLVTVVFSLAPQVVLSAVG